MDSEKLRYWLRQPIPVFVVFVAGKRDAPSPIYICPIDNAVDRLTSRWRITTAEEMRQFIEVALPLQVFLWDLKQGKVGFLQPPSFSYTVRIPVGYAQHFEGEIHGVLDRALCRLSEDLLKTSYDIDNLRELPGMAEQAKVARETARPYMDALKVIVDGRGATGFFEHVNMGVKAELDGNLEVARANYSAALNSIDGDTHIPQLPAAERQTWGTTRSKVERHLARVNARMGSTAHDGGM